jgi:hypothetical protein
MENKLNILVAYPYMKPPVIEILKNNQDNIRFLLDSGAFTAWKSGKPIGIDDYCKFLEQLPFKPWRYFTLDKIGDAEGSFKNYEIMLKRGFTPIPVFTRGEDVKMIDEYYKTSDVLGIGGLVGIQGNKGFVKGIMSQIGDRKVHWLGFNPKEFIHYYKPYTCDSSSWSAAVRYAACKVYFKNGKWIQLGKKDFITRPSSEILQIITEYGFDPKRLANKGQWKNSGTGKYALELLTCRSWSKYQIDLRNKLGVEFFLACTTEWQIRSMIEANQYWNNEGAKYL